MAQQLHFECVEEKMRNVIFDDNRISLPSLEKSLDAYSKRQRAIANNIANAETPGYQAQKVSFEDQYRKYLYRGKSLPITRTDPKHIPLKYRNLNEVTPRALLRESTLNDTGINNVDIEKEMSELAQNSLRYEQNVNLLRKRFLNLKSSIKGR